MNIIRINTRAKEEFIDITLFVKKIVKQNDWKNGAVHLFCIHTTCGLTINESADPDVREDLAVFFENISPETFPWKHAEGNSIAHIRSSILGVSLLIPLENGSLTLGTWQAIYLYEGDGPRERKILVQFLPALN